DLWTGLSDTVSGVFNTMMGWLDKIGSAIGSAITAAGALASNPAAALGFASGGMVRGAGSSTSDSILARLSNGEFVMRAAAVQHWGPAFMAALNGLRIPGFSLGALPAFAEGGLVAASGGGQAIAAFHFESGQ